MRKLFHAGRQLIKVRGVMFLSLGCAVGCVWAGIDLAQSYGLNPADGGVLAPLSVRLAWGIGGALLGIIFLVGMWIYGKCYVARIEFDEQNKALHIYTVSFFGSEKHEINASKVLSSQYHEGELNLDIYVNAPWWTVWIKGRRLPFIVDEQGVFLEKNIMNKLFKI